jgi:hypothetical protein
MRICGSIVHLFIGSMGQMGMHTRALPFAAARRTGRQGGGGMNGIMVIHLQPTLMFGCRQ